MITAHLRPSVSKYLLAAVAGVSLLSAAQAQPDGAGPHGPGAPGLGGPEVRERRGPRGEGDFGGGGPEFRRGKENAERGLGRAYKGALEAVMGPDAAPEIRVSDEQREAIAAIGREHAEQMRAFMDQHRDEIAQLRGKGAGGDDNARKANLQRSQEIMKDAPSAKDAYNRAWQLLNPAQQQAVSARLAEIEQSTSERRQDEYVRRRAGRGSDGNAPRADRGPEGKAPPADRGPAGSPRAGGPDAGRRERLMRLFEQMSLEQQDQLLRRLEERNRGPGEAGPRERRPRRSGPSPDASARPPMQDEPMQDDRDPS